MPNAAPISTLSPIAHHRIDTWRHEVCVSTSPASPSSSTSQSSSSSNPPPQDAKWSFVLKRVRSLKQKVVKMQEASKEFDRTDMYRSDGTTQAGRQKLGKNRVDENQEGLSGAEAEGELSAASESKSGATRGERGLEERKERLERAARLLSKNQELQ